jgi:hypothetical protein
LYSISIKRERAGDTSVALSEDQLLQMAQMLAEKQLQKAGSLSLDAVLLLMDVLQGRGDLAACRRLLEGPCQRAVDIPHELLRLRVCSAYTPDGVAVFGSIT